MERRHLLTSLEKTHVAMQNCQNRLSLDRKRSQEKEQGSKQEMTSHSVSPSRQPLAKGHACDLTQMKEDKLASRLPEIRVDAPAFLRNVNRTSMHSLKVAHLPWVTVKVKAPPKQKCVEIQLDEALDNLHNMTTERDSLAQQMRVSQEQAASEQMYLIQRVKDLQGTIHELDQERYDFRSKQAVKDEQVLGLESQIHTCGSKLAIAEEELKKSDTECSALRELKIKMDSAISESQLRLMAKDRELQKVLDRNKYLEERNDSLFEQVDGVREEVSTLQSVTFQLSQDKNALQEQLERKAQLDKQALQRKVEGSSQEVELLHSKLQEYMTERSQKNILFSSKEEVIKSLQLRVQELEMSTEGVQQTVSERNTELETVRKKLTITEEALDTVVREKDATIQENADLRDDLDKVQLDNQALQRKVEGSSQEVELLQKKLKDCINESSCSKILLTSKEEVIEHLEGIVKELNSSAMSLQQEVNRGNRELVAIQRELSNTVENLDIVEMEKEGTLQENTDLRKYLVKAQSENQALQRKVEGSSEEVELLQKKLQDHMAESSCSKILLSSDEEVIGSLRLTVEELETSGKSLQQEVDRESRELKTIQRKLKDTEENLESVVSEKGATLEAHTTLRDGHDRVQLDNHALQRKVDGSSKDVEILQKKLHAYITESARTSILLSCKEEVNELLQLRVQQLETSAKSLQQDVRKRDRKLDAIQTTRRNKMDDVVRAIPQANTPTQIDLDKIQLENQALQHKVEGSSQEVDILQKKLCNFVSKTFCVNDQLSLKEDVIENLQLTVKEREMSVKSLQQEVNRGNRELEFTQKRLSNTEEILSAVMQEKGTMLKENLDLRDDLHKVQSDNQALQRKVEGSSQEVELLQLDLQDSSTDVNSLQTWVSSSEAAIARLLQIFEELQPSAVSLQQEVNRGNRELDTVRTESVNTNVDLGALVQETTLQESSADR
ncbi:hypothetical protein AAFF_G00239530 [Aldrovandia affinis]|uniref:Uncharacterized protein n=1 Tax=Aldrovandia affinis TaxID=143900 RepID=A0AAD7RDV6_9TELE|nr:hypothetical protein AAFF_G00239530 [Aldrovandia affinis]